MILNKLRRVGSQLLWEQPFIVPQLGHIYGNFRLDSNQPLQPVMKQNEGFPLCVSASGTLPLAFGLVREDIIRFFNKCQLHPEDIKVQYSATFRPQCWWIRFHSKEDRQKAMSIRDPRWGGRLVLFEEKGISEWEDGTFNHLVGNSLGSAILVTRLPYQTTDEDVASFFRNFHLQGNGVTLIQDPMKPNFDQQEQFKRAIVRLISKQEAQRASRSLHRRFVRGSAVFLRVLQ